MKKPERSVEENKYGVGVDFAKQKTVERSVEEMKLDGLIVDIAISISRQIAKQNNKEVYKTAKEHLKAKYEVDEAINELKNFVTQTLQAERQKRDEMVEAERERIWTEVSMKTPTLLANYPRGKKDNYNSGRIDGWNICKSFIRQLTHPNNPK